MRRYPIALATALAAVLLAASCTDRSNPTRPLTGKVSANIVPGTCTTLANLQSLVNTVFGAGSPNASSALGKLNNLDHFIQQGNFSGAQTSALNLVSFIQQKAPTLPGGAQAQALINAIECYAGLLQNTFLVMPTDSAQVIISSDGVSGIKLPGNPVSQPTLITFNTLDTNASPLVTDLDQYPVYVDITQQSGVTNSLIAPVIVAVCPVVGIPDSILSRLRLGHQASYGFEITPSADASFLSCANLASTERHNVPAWMHTLASLILPKPAYARMRLSGGVGGTATELSPFGPVDPILGISGGVGGTATELRPTKTRSGVSASVHRAAGGVSAQVVSVACTQAVNGAALPPECRPMITVATARGHVLANVPVSWAVTAGGGQTAAEATDLSCGVFGTTASNATSPLGNAGACWTIGPVAGANSLTSTPSAGGDAPAGVTFSPAVTTFNVTGIKAIAPISLGGLHQTYDGTPKTVTASTTPAGLTTLTITYNGSTTPPTGAGSYAISVTLDNPSWDGSATGTLVVDHAAQPALSVVAPATAAYLGGTVQLATGGGAGTGAVTYDASTTPAACTVNASTGAVTILIGTGSCVVSATKAGDSNYLPVTSPVKSITLTRASQTISFGGLGAHTYGDAPFTVSATASSSLPVTFALAAGGQCTISGATVTITGAGACTVIASQAGNASYYNAAAPVSQGFAIMKHAATATAGSATMFFGTTVPSMPCTVSGLLAADAGSVTCTTVPPAATLAGMYATTPSVSPASPINYAVASVNGTLTIQGYTQQGCFALPMTQLAPPATAGLRKGTTVQLKCTLDNPSGQPVLNATGSVLVQDRGVDGLAAPTTAFSASNVFALSNGNGDYYSYKLSTSTTPFIKGHYYLVTATWNDGTTTQGWFLLSP